MLVTTFGVLTGLPSTAGAAAGAVPRLSGNLFRSPSRPPAPAA